jgi:predicted CoA-binding protein
MASAAAIEAFLTNRRIAMIGVSVCPSDVTRIALRELLARGYDILPIRPGVKELDGRRAFPSVFDVTGPIDGAMIFTTPCRSERVVYDCLRREILRYWLDPGDLRGTSPDAIELCERSAQDLIIGGRWPASAPGPAAPAPRPHRISLHPLGALVTRLAKAGAAS